MDGIESERKKITLSSIIRYVFGVIFILFGIVYLSSGNYISGLFFILAAVITIRPAMDFVEKSLNISMSRTATIFVVFCFVIVALAAVPQSISTTGNRDGAVSSQSATSDTSSAVETTEKTHKTGSIPFISAYYKCGSWSNEQYPLITLFGENYVPLLPSNEHIWNARVDKLASLVLDSGDKYTIRTGETLDLGQGYTLQAKQVDVDGKKVWFEFDKDGKYIDDPILSNNLSDKKWTDENWTCKVDNIQGEDDVPVLKVHLNQTFPGAVDSFAQIDGLWLIDYANATTLKVGDKFGNVILTEINNGIDDSNLGSLVFEPSVTSAEQTTLEPEKEVTPTVVASWEGESTKNTETFHISSNEWKIMWKTNPGQYGDMNFQIYVYNSNGSLKDVAANVIGESTDSTIMRGSGDYYLKINTAQPYAIEIQE